MSYVYVGIAVILLAFEFACSKKYQANEGTDLVAGLRFNGLTGLTTSIIMLCILGFRLEWSAYSLGLAVAQTLCCIFYSVLGFRVLRLGGMALYSTFLMSGGMLLPYLVGVIFWEEQLSILRVLGVVMILGAVILSNFSRSKTSPKLILLCCVVFLLNGMVSIISKLHQISTIPTVGTTTFVMYAGLSKSLVCFAVLPFLKKPGPFMTHKPSYGVIVGAALIGGTSYLLQLLGAKDLPATVLYPMITGGCMIVSAIAGRVFFRETLSKRQIFCIAICFAGTLLFL